MEPDDAPVYQASTLPPFDNTDALTAASNLKKSINAAQAAMQKRDELLLSQALAAASIACDILSAHASKSGGTPVPGAVSTLNSVQGEPGEGPLPMSSSTGGPAATTQAG